jgi:hypothetical protein
MVWKKEEIVCRIWIEWTVKWGRVGEGKEGATKEEWAGEGNADNLQD